MTELEKTETLAKWCGKKVAAPKGLRRVVLHDENGAWLEDENRWWNPLHNVADAMELFEHMVQAVAYVSVGHHQRQPLDRRFACYAEGVFCHYAATLESAICDAAMALIELKEQGA